MYSLGVVVVGGYHIESRAALAGGEGSAQAAAAPPPPPSVPAAAVGLRPERLYGGWGWSPAEVGLVPATGCCAI